MQGGKWISLIIDEIFRISKIDALLMRRMKRAVKFGESSVNI